MGASRSVLLAAAALGLGLRLAFGFGYWTDQLLTRDEREYLPDFLSAGAASDPVIDPALVICAGAALTARQQPEDRA